jgi:hypothetical protein
VVELEQDRVAALQQARTNIATDRNVRLGIAQDCHIDKEFIKIAIRRFENQRAVAIIKKQDFEKLANALRAAYLGLETPQSILKDLDGRTERTKDFDNQIEQIDSALSELREQLTEADARRCLA